MPYGFDNNCETNNKTNIEVLHAETNAIAKIAKTTNSSKDSILYVSHSPCIECAKLIIQAGIIKVYYKYEYRNLNGVEFLRKSNIEVIKII